MGSVGPEKVQAFVIGPGELIGRQRRPFESPTIYSLVFNISLNERMILDIE